MSKPNLNRPAEPDPQPTLRVMRSVANREFPWFIVAPNGHVYPQLFATQAAAESYRQHLLKRGGA